MVSSVTREAFPPRAQKVLANAARQQGFRSRYWFTLGQMRRTLGGRLKPNSAPTSIALQIESVVPFAALPDDVQSEILDLHPPHFERGIGILTHRFKWNVCLSQRMLKCLDGHNMVSSSSGSFSSTPMMPHPHDDGGGVVAAARGMFVDTSFLPSLLKSRANMKLRTSSNMGGKEEEKAEGGSLSVTQCIQDGAIDVRAASTVQLFNADQLEDPFVGGVPAGMVIDAATGRRLPQPASHILLAVQILRGYTSPYWISESQAIRLDLKWKKSSSSRRLRGEGAATSKKGSLPNEVQGVRVDAVAAATMSGRVVRLGDLASAAPELHKELKDTLDSTMNERKFLDASSSSFFTSSPSTLLFTVMGWEKIRSVRLIRILKRLADADDETYLREFSLNPTESAATTQCYVNVDDVAVVLAHRRWELDSMLTAHFAPIESVDAADPIKEVGDDEHKRQRPYFLDLGIATRCHFYNIECFEKPHLITPVFRPIAVVNGRQLCRRAEAQLRNVALNRKFTSPLWLTEGQAKSLGLGILPAEKGRGAHIHSDSAARRGILTGAVTFYHISDVDDAKRVLDVHPTDLSSRRHKVLDGKWRPLHGQSIREALDSRLHSGDGVSALEATENGVNFTNAPLWLSENEIVMSGLSLKPTAIPLRVSRGGNGEVSVVEANSLPDAGGEDVRSDQPHPDDATTEAPSTFHCRAVLYNSQQTTDPVRAIGLAPLCTRPQLMQLSSL